MKARSLRLRLLVAGALTIALALLAAGLGLSVLFERHVERRVTAELGVDIRQLLAGLDVGADGSARLLREPRSQRYSQPFSGRYWQIEKAEEVVLRSRSLWDGSLAMPASETSDGGAHQHRIAGPNGEDLIAVERVITVARSGKKYRFELVAAIDRREIIVAVTAFRQDMVLALGGLGIALMTALWIAISLGLGPLQSLRSHLNRVRSGDAARLDGDFPSEVEPLVADLNELLDYQEKSIAQARTRAGDLAHGLKTPLTAIGTLSEEIRARGDEAVASELELYVETMRRHVEHELVLARARTPSRRSGATGVARTLGPLIRTMRKLPGGEKLDWRTSVPPGAVVSLDATILMELLGNLLDNARKWARTTVVVNVRPGADGVAITVEDDGPGVAAEELALIVERGGRLDERTDGSGLGLAIVRDIIEAVAGSLTIERSDLGGLRIRLVLDGPTATGE